MNVVRQVSFVVDVAPGKGRINERSKVQRRGNGAVRIGKSDAYKAFIAEVSLAASRQRCARFADGLLGVAITFYTATARDPKNFRGIPPGYLLATLDVDASVKGTLDGLKSGGLIDDDVRFVELHVRKRVDRARQRVAIRVWRLPDDAC